MAKNIDTVKNSDETALTVGTKTVAVLDESGYLIGSTHVTEDTPGLDFGDLPTDGTYKWDDKHKQFLPLGHGFGKVSVNQPCSTELVIARLIEAIADTVNVPAECVEWKDWYDLTLRKRDEELSRR